MKQKIEKVLNKWSMKYKQLHATDDDIIIEASDFQNISHDIMELMNRYAKDQLSELLQKPNERDKSAIDFFLSEGNIMPNGDMNSFCYGAKKYHDYLEDKINSKKLML